MSKTADSQLKSARGPSRAPAPDTIGGRIRMLRIGAKMTQGEVAEHLHTTTPTISRYETNEFPPPEAVIVRLADLFQVTRGFIRDGDQSSRVAPIVGIVGAGAQVIPPHDDVRLGGVEVPASWSDAVAFEVRGDSCLPLYQDKGHIVIRGAARFEPAETLRRMSVVELADGRTLVKELLRGEEAGVYDLISPNASPIQGVEVLVARPVKAYFPPDS